MTDYVTIDEVKSLLGITDASDDAALDAALSAAVEYIDMRCGGSFEKDDTASARVFEPRSSVVVRVDGFWDLASLVVKTDDDGDGTYETTWTVDTDFIVGPRNGRRNGRAWAYNTLTAVGSRGFPCDRRRPVVQVTAKWGWPAVPEPVAQATRLLTVANWKRKDAAFGVAGFAEFGAIRVREDPDVDRLLSPFTPWGVA